MKLSKETLNVVKNFASINGNLLIKAGSTLSTISAHKNIMAETTVTETFPVEFGIYDVNEFLGALSLFNEPELSFSDKYVSIIGDGNTVKYFASSASVLNAPTKSITFPESDIEFMLPEKVLSMIIRTSGVLRSADLSIVGDGVSITANVGDKKNASGNSYSTVLGETTETFKVNLLVENLKMLPGSYKVSISSKKISRFQAVTGDLVYYVAVEADSKFN